MNPKASKIFCIETNKYLTLNSTETSQYTYNGNTQTVNSIRCATFRKEGDTNTYCQPWENLAFIRVQGEKNISAKLKTVQVRQIVKDVYTKQQGDVTYESLATKYGVTADTIASIAIGQSWRHVTVGLIAQLKAGNKEVLESVISASNKAPRKKNVKLNGSLAAFIVRDHMLNKIPINKLADKFNLDPASIRRVVNGKAWMATTIPAIAACAKFLVKGVK